MTTRIISSSYDNIEVNYVLLWHSLSAFSGNFRRAARLCPAAFSFQLIHKRSVQLCSVL
jgi:hypothetical protein